MARDREKGAVLMTDSDRAKLRSLAEAATPFWRSVRELAAMRSAIPEERRELSLVRQWFKEQQS